MEFERVLLKLHSGLGGAKLVLGSGGSPRPVWVFGVGFAATLSPLNPEHEHNHFCYI